MNIFLMISGNCNAGPAKKNCLIKDWKLSTIPGYDVHNAELFTALNQPAGEYWQIYRKSKKTICLLLFLTNPFFTYLVA